MWVVSITRNFSTNYILCWGSIPRWGKLSFPDFKNFSENFWGLLRFKKESLRVIKGSSSISSNNIFQVPALSGFWITTLVLQTPIEIFLFFSQNVIPLPLERIMYIIHLIFLFFEVIYIICILFYPQFCQNSSFL